MRLLSSVFGKTAIATAALSGFLLFAGAPSVKAQNWGDCRSRVARAEQNLAEAIEDHGYNSRQARNSREALRIEQQRCWNEQNQGRNRSWRDDRGNYDPYYNGNYDPYHNGNYDPRYDPNYDPYYDNNRRYNRNRNHRDHDDDDD
ncbi:MAG TPA: hypothetical protein VOA64_03075 [Candidatus Dormibacteraeota bacterium]|nr:hypothetical protein [Candidatus Dormibacteraeota bacterium]